MKAVQVALTNGGHVLVDERDLALVESHNWYAVKSRGTMYAKTGKNSRMHRMILGVDNSLAVVDHINGNGLDNRRSNLRVVFTSENVANRQRSRIGNRCPGVYKQGRKWLARVTVDYTQVRLGLFENEDDAIAAVNAFRKSIGRPVAVISE